jgi:hypothetical protein
MAYTWQDAVSGEYPAGGERPFVTVTRLARARTWPTVEDATHAAERAGVERFEVLSVEPQPASARQR